MKKKNTSGMNDPGGEPDFIVMPRKDGKWLLTREGRTREGSTVFPSLLEAVAAGREKAREEHVRLRIQDVGGDTGKHRSPGEAFPDWVEPE